MTLAQFRALHGDPQTWSSAEVEEYLAECDRVEATPALRLDQDVVQAVIGGVTRSGKGRAA